MESRCAALDPARHWRSWATWPCKANLSPGDEGEVDLVIKILRTAPGVKIVITSRAKLNMQCEHLFPISGMNSPDPDALKDAAFQQAQDIVQYDAVKLFLTGARRVQPDFDLRDGNVADVVRICRLVQGTPLGILLAAAWVETLPPSEIAVQISQNLDFLEMDWHDVRERQRSMRAVFDHSWNLLTVRERTVFQALSVFRGGFTHAAAQQVIGASLRESTALANKSLLIRTSTERYEIHELLRQYAAEKLDQAPVAREAVHDQHTAYYAAALQRWGADSKGPRQQAALAEIGTDSENARAAWNWAVERGQVGRLEQGIEGLCRFCEWRRRYQEGETACRTAADKLEVVASGDGLRVWAKTLTWQGFFNWGLGRAELADQLLRQSLTLLNRPALADQDVRLEKAFVLWQMGHVAADSDREEARQLYGQSLALYQALGARWETANALNALGRLTWLLGAYDEARQLHEESLAIRQALGDQRGIANSLGGLGSIALYQAQLEEAEHLKRESVAIHQEIGDRAGVAIGLNDLGATLLYLGKFVEAHSLLEESLAIWNDLGFRRGAAFSHIWLGFAQAHLGRYEQARAQVQKGLALSREIGHPQGIGSSLLILGGVALAEEAYAKAQQLFQESVAICQEIGQKNELAGALAALGVTARGLGNPRQARQHLFKALRTAAEIRAFAPLMFTLAAIALLLADQGEQERAVELYAMVARYPAVANSRRFEDTVGRHIAAVAASLPPDVVAAAQERGKARGLWVTAAELLVELGGK